jgi:hypothetical protein
LCVFIPSHIILLFFCPAVPQNNRKPISSVVIDNTISVDNNNNNNNNKTNSKPQVCNPPMVHCLTWSPNGESLAAGLGDGTIGMFAIENRSLVQTGLLGIGSSSSGNNDVGHDSSVASVTYPCFSHGTADRILCSAGSDGSILFWDLGSVLCNGGWNDDDDDDDIETDKKTSADGITELFASSLLMGDDDKKSGRRPKQYDQPTILFGIPHERKMNWVTPATRTVVMEDDDIQSNENNHNNNNMFVADTSSDITMYTIPLQ